MKNIFCYIILTLFAVACGNSSKTSASVETTEGTKSCLIGYDWVYPSTSNPRGAWKFSSDGTFNSSTTMFGGMSAWGN
jgi:hypothetical protein